MKKPLELRIQIAQDLTEIERLVDALPNEAEHHSASKLFPGGDALALAVPGTSMTAWQFRFSAAEAKEYKTDQAREQALAYVADAADEYHPHMVLAEWEDKLRYDHGQPTDLDSTVSRSADYIRGKVDWMLETDDAGRYRFPGVLQLADHLANVRRALEDAEKAGHRAEWVDVRCINPECVEKPRLMKIWGRRAAWDVHRCPACRTRYDDREFKVAKHQQLTDQGADRWVTVSDAAASAQVPLDTTNSWVRRLNVPSVCDLRTRRVMVWWPAVRDRAEVRRDRLVVARQRAAVRRQAKAAEREAKEAAARAEAEARRAERQGTAKA